MAEDTKTDREIRELRERADRLERESRDAKDREFHERLRRVGCEYEDGTDFGD